MSQQIPLPRNPTRTGKLVALTVGFRSAVFHRLCDLSVSGTQIGRRAHSGPARMIVREETRTARSGALATCLNGGGSRKLTGDKMPDRTDDFTRKQIRNEFAPKLDEAVRR